MTISFFLNIYMAISSTVLYNRGFEKMGGGIDDGKKHLYVIVEMRKVGVFVFL